MAEDLTQEGTMPADRSEAITRDSILTQLPRIVSEHTMLVSTLGLRNVIQQRATFWIDVPHHRRGPSRARSFALADDKIEDIFDLYLQECERQMAFDTAVVVALCPNVEQVLKVRSMFPHVNRRVFQDALYVLVQREYLALVADILPGRPRRELDDLLKNVVIRCSESTDRDLEKCVELLVARCDEQSVLKEVTEGIINFCDASLLKAVLSRSDIHPWRWRWTVRGWSVSLLGLLVARLVEETKRHTRLNLSRSCCQPSLYDCLLASTIQTGVSTRQGVACHRRDLILPLQQRPTPLLLSAFGGMADLVQLLYDTGATTYSELFQLSSCATLTQDLAEGCRDSCAARRVEQLVRRAAGHPRRLQQLCTLTVSRCIGCGTADHREMQVRTLRLPSVLQDEILFLPALKVYTAGRHVCHAT